VQPGRAQQGFRAGDRVGLLLDLLESKLCLIVTGPSGPPDMVGVVSLKGAAAAMVKCPESVPDCSANLTSSLLGLFHMRPPHPPRLPLPHLHRNLHLAPSTLLMAHNTSRRYWPWVLCHLLMAAAWARSLWSRWLPTGPFCPSPSHRRRRRRRRRIRSRWMTWQ
jgi:hypothetical protein